MKTRSSLFVVWLVLWLAACSQTSTVSEKTVQVLRTPQSLPTQTTIVTIPALPSPTATTILPIATSVPTATIIPTDTAVSSSKPTATVTPTATPYPYTTIGRSVEGRPIVSHRFGDGPIPIILVGGIHGGYEWNTILLAYEMIDYFEEFPERIPPDITLYIIPSANPDGQFLITGSHDRFTLADIPSDDDTLPGRFNANDVDLNRNWDCEWSKTAVWRDQTVSGGSSPFSELESNVLRNYFLEQQPSVVIFWHSAANGVFSSGCPEPFPNSLQLAAMYGEAANYPVYERFYHYPVTGDAGDWLATQGIPSISVELKTHEDIDWTENLAGVLMILDHFGNSIR